MNSAGRKWVSIETASDFLSIPKKTIYSLAGRGLLPAGAVLKVGRSIRFDLAAIEAGLANSKGRRS